MYEKAPPRVLFCGVRQTFSTMKIDFTLNRLVFKLAIISIQKINRNAKWIWLNRFTDLAQPGKSRHNEKRMSETKIPDFLLTFTPP
ncbi:hypothetical protein BN439_2876 [Erwinia amylovora Ea644]|nr:hypothetical protein BN439_2876 [Erwinia amylovora Ea644]CCP07975.1 hypothetical protein BN440_2969 [Erwinia amylovora MR1]